MPIYEYKREDGTVFEVMGKFSDPPLTTDPETGQPVTRVFSPVSVHFKGSGFYNTDYGTAKRKRESDGSKKSESSSSEGGSSGSGTSSGGDSSSSGGADSGSSGSSASDSGSGSSGASTGAGSSSAASGSSPSSS